MKKNVLISLLLVVFFVTAQAALGQVMINEIMVEPVDDDTGQFIELYNTGPDPVDIDGWGIHDLDDTNDIIGDYTDATNDWGLSGTVIPVNGYAIIVDSEYEGEYNDYLNANADPTKVIMVTNTQDTTLGNNPGLDESSDTIILENGLEAIDEVNYHSDNTPVELNVYNVQLTTPEDDHSITTDGTGAVIDFKGVLNLEFDTEELKEQLEDLPADPGFPMNIDLVLDAISEEDSIPLEIEIIDTEEIEVVGLVEGDMLKLTEIGIVNIGNPTFTGIISGLGFLDLMNENLNNMLDNEEFIFAGDFSQIDDGLLDFYSVAQAPDYADCTTDSCYMPYLSSLDESGQPKFTFDNVEIEGNKLTAGGEGYDWSNSYYVESAIFPLEAGHSIELVHPYLDNNHGESWKSSQTEMSNGDYGTPGGNYNFPPSLNIPDETILEDSYTDSPKTWDLDEYASEEGLTYSFVSQTDTSAFSCEESLVGGILACYTIADESGSNTITLSVEDASGLSSEEEFTITVEPVEEEDSTAPTLNIVNQEKEEDSYNIDSDNFTLDLDVLANDDETADEDLSFTIVNQTNSSVVLCSLSEHVLECNTQPDQHGTSTITIRVSDERGNSAEDAFDFVVTPVNDAPTLFNDAGEVQIEFSASADETVTTIPAEVNDTTGEIITDVEINEGIEYIIKVLAYDVDNAEEEELSLVLEESYDWITVDGLEMIFTAQDDDPTFEIVVTDGELTSETITIDTTQYPALDIEMGDIPILINGVAAEMEDDAYTVSPGDEVTVNIDFVNNYDRTLGEVTVEANAWSEEDVIINELFDIGEETQFPYQGVCVGVDCDDGHWALEPTETGTDSYTFTITNNVPEGFLYIDNEVSYNNFWDFLLWINTFEDIESITFYVEKDNVAAIIESAEPVEENLSCSGTLSVDLEVTNIGSHDLVPQILVYSQEKTGEFNHIVGEFASTAGKLHEENLVDSDDPLSAGDTISPTIDVNVSDLSVGEHTLWLYLVNPYFDRDGFYYEEPVQVTFTKEQCLLSTTPSEDTLTIPFDEPLTFEVEIPEGESPDITWLLVDGEEETPSGASYIFSENTPDEYTIKVIVANEGLEETRTWTVTVTEALSISNVAIDGNTIEENGESSNLIPQQEVQVTFTLTNNLDRAVTGIDTQLSFAGTSITSEESVNLDAGVSQTITLTQELPLTVTTGNYDATLSVSGKDLDDTSLIRVDSFAFILNVNQESADLVISDIELEEDVAEDGLTCAASTTLTVNYVNRGSQTETDAVLTLTGANINPEDEAFTTDPFTVGANSEGSQTFVIPLEYLTSGPNAITATLTYRDNFKSDTEPVTIQKNDCMVGFTPSEDSLVIADMEYVTFEVELAEEGIADALQWYVNDLPIPSPTDTTYTFWASNPDDYEIKVAVKNFPEEERTWDVTVSNVPITTFTTNIPEDVTNRELETFSEFSVENSFGRIVFQEPVDLSDVTNMDSLIIIGADAVSVDSNSASDLDHPAQITLFKTFDNHAILYSPDFNSNELEFCPETICRAISNTGGEFIFTVTGFSTYKVVEEVAAGIEVSDIEITDASRGADATATFTVTNSGTFEPLTGLTAQLVGVSSDYSATLTGVPSSLSPTQSANVQLSLSVPEDENGGRHSIGQLEIISNEVTKLVTIYIEPQSFLLIDEVDVNDGDDLSIEETNEIVVTIKNDYDEDMEDVRVTVTLLDIDGDDIDERSEKVDIDAGEDEDFTLEFDLSGEDIDEEDIEMEIKVEGTATDDSEHETVETRNVDLDIEDHKVILRRVSLANSVLECGRFTALEVTVENVGSSNEDDVEVRVTNSALGIDLKRGNIDLDKFSRKDNDKDMTFTLDLEGVAAGTYSLDVEVYLDGDREESEEVSLTVKDCLTTSTTTGPSTGQLAQQLQQQLGEINVGEIPTPEPIVKSSFRDTTTYTYLLLALVVLLVIAVILAIAVMGKK